ncbi:MAG: PatB family C-S lyase [Pseudomonadota bacterium]
MNFDEIKDRRAIHSAKWGALGARTGATADDAIAMWIADMDFDAPDCVLQALRDEVDEGFLGYFGQDGPVNEAVCGWMAQRHGWPVEPSWIRYTHGVVAAFGSTLHAFSDPGDSIILFTPVYHAFFGKAASMDREVLQSRLVLQDGAYHMDLESLAGQLTGREKIAVLCSPHNPGGRLWSDAEIKALAAFCCEHNLIMLSDEIHMDLTFPGVSHRPSAVAAPESTPYLITITAASKSFNMAGMETGVTIIEDPDLRARFDASEKVLGGMANRFGMVMTKAAFTKGAEWSDAARAYIADNFAIWSSRVGALPGIEVMGMHATYLAWVNFEKTGLGIEEVTERLTQRARIGMSPGSQFGAGGDRYHRFNIAMPRARLMEAIERIEAAFADVT